MRFLLAYTESYPRQEDTPLSLLAWIAVPIIAYALVRLLFSNPRRGRRMSIWEHFGHIVIYSLVSFCIWHFIHSRPS